MNAEKIFEQFIAAHSAKDINAIGSLLSEELEFTTLLGILGKKDYVDFSQAITAAMPDLAFKVEKKSATGNDVLLNFGLSGTHKNTFTLHAPGMKPLPPTNKFIDLAPDLLHYVVAGDKIVKIYPEPGHEGGVVFLLREMGAKLPPLWIPRLVNRVTRRLSERKLRSAR